MQAHEAHHGFEQQRASECTHDQCTDALDADHLRRPTRLATDAAHALDVVGSLHEHATHAARPPEVDRNAQVEGTHVMPPAARDVDDVARVELSNEQLGLAQPWKTYVVALLDIDAATVGHTVEECVGV